MSRELSKRIAGLIAVVALVAPGAGYADPGTVPTVFTDHSANRVDTEVFGWSVDFTQVAAVAVNVNRGPGGKQRGQVLLVAFNVNDVKPIENVEINIITAADLPHDPIPLDDAKSKLMDIDYNVARMWPRRAQKKRPEAWMNVETLWDPVHVTATECQPAVSFVLEYGGETRFQPHQIISDVRANCKLLRMTHNRTYWGRPDLAAVMPKFEWSPDDHEMSFRYPVSAKWSRARELRFLVRSSDPRDTRTQKIAEKLSRYGRVRLETAPRNASSGIMTTNELKLLGDRFAGELSLSRTTLNGSASADVVVTLGGDDPERPVARYSPERLR